MIAPCTLAHFWIIRHRRLTSFCLLQLGPLQEQLLRSDAQLARLITALRTLLSTDQQHSGVSAMPSNNSSLHSNPALGSPAQLLAAGASIASHAELAQELASVLGAEAAKRSAQAQEALGRASMLESALRERDNELALAQAKAT